MDSAVHFATRVSCEVLIGNGKTTTRAESKYLFSMLQYKAIKVSLL